VEVASGPGSVFITQAAALQFGQGGAGQAPGAAAAAPCPSSSATSSGTAAQEARGCGEVAYHPATEPVLPEPGNAHSPVYGWHNGFVAVRQGVRQELQRRLLERAEVGGRGSWVDH
jgi:hypothetical protein